MTATTTKRTTDQAIITQLKAMGFSDDYVPPPKRLIVCLSGREKVGKTHFALTAPDPIFFINVDLGTEGVVNKFQEQGKQIYVYDVRVPRLVGVDVYAPMWENLKTVFQKVYRMQRGSVVVDTDTEVYELARLAKFGKLSQVMPQNYTEVNNEYREILRLAYDSPMNSIFIHKMKPLYINNARTKDYTPAGFGDMEYNSQVNLLLYRDDGDEEDEPEFSCYIKDCRWNASVNGRLLSGPMCDFNFLLELIHAK